MTAPNAYPGTPLTPTEWAVLRAAATGAPDKVIGYDRHVSEQTVSNHLGNLYAKLGVQSRIEAFRAVGWLTDGAGTAATPVSPALFPAWLRANLREHNWSQRDLARRSGVNHSTVSRLLSGPHASPPSLWTAHLLAAAFREGLA